MSYLACIPFLNPSHPSSPLHRHSPIISMTPRLNILTINARCAVLCRYASSTRFVLAVVVDVFEVEGVEVAGQEAREVIVSLK